ncbi:TetR/AcrR family transcriptional regulator [Amycolatopsis sp. NPDC059021]|uniref:TetR/AcrR family transcriptional regulator n=1 Tax=Amycolatopsis sp. NPDC059021 TaxID=3346704 RepID=UPI003672DD6C
MRRTQEQRSAATRARLLEATIDCLVEEGYAGTTTTRVAERAGVTRGALVHHYPAKADLVTAAVRHLATARTDLAQAELERLRAADDPVGIGLDLLWSVHSGPLFRATVELWTAARSDAELRAQLREVEQLVTGALLEFVAGLYPELAADREVRHWLYTAMDVVRGILVSEVAAPGPGSAEEAVLERRWQRAKRHLRLLAPSLAART